ncbi:hypothetical protein GCM10009789_86780 [Kribbella sancticallisti]|uniref:Uncharacterized protein n=1 Tax=Kribbella sancticallisti TaxID=460087 RepID=A0ABN2EY83_9ACTN
MLKASARMGVRVDEDCFAPDKHRPSRVQPSLKAGSRPGNQLGVRREAPRRQESARAGLPVTGAAGAHRRQTPAVNTPAEVTAAPATPGQGRPTYGDRLKHNGLPFLATPC